MSARLSSGLAIPLIAFATFPGPARAQTAAAAAKPGSSETIVVTATGLSQALSSTKTRTPIIDSPQTISIVSREEIELRASPTVSDALSYLAGVQAAPSGLDSRVDEVSVRGFGAGGFSSNNNFVDGLRLPSGGQWTRTSFDPFALQQIEVLKGPSGALYGQTAPGGVVNLTTKRPTDHSEGEFFVQGAGYTGMSNWQGQGAADRSGRLNASGSLTGRIVALARDGGTQVNDIQIGRYYISPSLSWTYAPRSSWTLLAQYQRDQGGSNFQFLPATGSLHASNGRHIANDANIGEPDWNTFDRNQALVGSFLEHRFNRFLTFRNNTRYTYIDTLYRVTVLSGDTLAKCPKTLIGCIPGATINRRAVEGRGRSQGVASDNQLEGHAETGPVHHPAAGDRLFLHELGAQPRRGRPGLCAAGLRYLRSRAARGYGLCQPSESADLHRDEEPAERAVFPGPAALAAALHHRRRAPGLGA